MAKAIIWSRVSTTSQELESQKKDLIKIATSKPFSFNKSDLIFIGDAGASAIKMNDLYQQEVNQLIQTIDCTSDIAAVFVWEVSRLARNKIAFQQMTAKLIENKIQLKCIVPDIKLLDENGELNNGMELTFDLLITLAKQEMDIKKKRFARGKKTKAEQGKYNGGAIPFGYRVDREHEKKIVIDEEDSKIVKLIYNKYEMGLSQPKIAKELYELGLGRIKISLVNNVLNNESYTGKEIKQKNASYERKYPAIISQEQFDKCRKIARTNNTLASKTRNIYYAEHLVKCKHCGAYFAANSAKCQYHCAVAFKPMSIWRYENHKKEKCNSRTGIGINLLDSILWDVAIDREALYRETEIEENIKRYNKEIEDIRRKIASIQPRVDDEKQKRERLHDLYIEGDISKEKYEKKKRIITEKLDAIRAESIPLQNELERVEGNIEHLRSIEPMKVPDYIDVNDTLMRWDWEEASEKFSSEYAYLHFENMNELKRIVSDKERYDIIHRQIKSVEINPIDIKIEKNGKVKEGREVVIRTYLPYSHLDSDNTIVYITIGRKIYRVLDERINGFSYPRELYPELYGDLYNENYEIVESNPYSMWVRYKGHEGQFYGEISEINKNAYLHRFTDYIKNKRREKEKQKAYKPVEGYFRIEDVMTMGNLKSGQVYSAIYRGTLKAQKIRHKMFIAPDEAEHFLAKVKKEKEIKGDKLSAFEVARKFNRNYQYVLNRVKSEKIPSEYVNGGYLIKLEDAERFFSYEEKGIKRREMDGYLSAIAIAKKYGISYKSVRKIIRQGEIASSKRGGYYYVSPKDAEEYFGKMRKG